MRKVRASLLLLATVIIAVVAYRRNHPLHPALKPVSPNDMVLEVRSIPVSHSMDFGEFTVSPKVHQEFKITVDEREMRNTHIGGHFSAEGGSGVQAMLLDNAQHDSYLNSGTPSGTFYMSKTTNGADIQAALPHGGTYYLIFDNPNPTDVKVKASVTMHYDTVHVDSPPSASPQNNPPGKKK